MSVDLQGRLEDLVGTHQVPGVAVGVIADGVSSTAAAGVADLGTGVPATADSAFMIQSITKVWTATLALQLVDEGLVGLDDLVVRHLPEFRTADPQASAEITVRHLLTHTGGFEGDLWAPGPSHDALARFVTDQVAEAAQHTAPGTVWSYCSAGYGVLGRIVEVHRDTTYAEALRRHLTGPLGVPGVVADAGEVRAHTTAIGHVTGPEGDLRPLATWAVLPDSNPAAGNQLAMPVGGLLALAALHLSDGQTPDGTRLLSPESVLLMRQPHVSCLPTTPAASSQGLGWRVTPAGMVEHGGGAPGTGALLRLHPETGSALAVVANGGDMGGLFAALADDVLGELEDVGTTDVAHHPGVDDPARYAGRFERCNHVAEVVADGSRLRLTTSERVDAAAVAVRAGVEPETTTTALVRHHGETFARLDADGAVCGWVEFLGSDESGRARLLHTGRTAPRVD